MGSRNTSDEGLAVLQRDGESTSATNASGSPSTSTLSFNFSSSSMDMDHLEETLEMGAASEYVPNTDPVFRLSEALSTADMDTVEELVLAGEVNLNTLFEKGKKITKSWYSGMGPLHILAHKGVVENVRKLLQLGADPLMLDIKGETALHKACKYARLECVKFLLTAAPQLTNICNSSGATPLLKTILKYQFAFRGTYQETVKVLLDGGADPSQGSLNGFTPLHVAAKNNDLVILSYLVQSGADINAKTCDGRTPLLICLQGRFVKTDCVMLLLNAGSDISVQVRPGGRQPLHIAVGKCDDSVVAKILEMGGDPNACDDFGMSPLWLAVRDNNVRIVSLLLAFGGNVNYCLPRNDNTTLLTLACTIPSPNIVRLLLEHGASITPETSCHKTPLFAAVEANSSAVVKLLVAANFDLERTSLANNSERWTPLQLAVHSGNAAMTRLLLDVGCSVGSVLQDAGLETVTSSRVQDALDLVMEHALSVQPLQRLCVFVIRPILGIHAQEKVQCLVREGVIPGRLGNAILLHDTVQP